jgi:antitoxin (DNA-binding transcriptional repressor) of toxin-antitoxin stability system
MDEVQQSRKEILIAKHGKPVASLGPANDEIPRIFGCMKDTITICGNIVAPTGKKWDADE